MYIHVHGELHMYMYTVHMYMHVHVHVQCMCIVNRVHYTSFYMYSLRDRYIHALCKSPIEPPVSKLNPSQEYVSYQVCVCGGGGGGVSIPQKIFTPPPPVLKAGDLVSCSCVLRLVWIGEVGISFISFRIPFVHIYHVHTCIH